MSIRSLIDKNDKERYSDQDMEDLIDWLSDLRLEQLFFIKDNLTEYYKYIAKQNGSEYVH